MPASVADASVTDAADAMRVVLEQFLALDGYPALKETKL